MWALLWMVFYNQNYNWHTHLMPNGFVIQHAHPYSHKNNSEHQHSQKSFDFLSSFSSTWFNQPTVTIPTLIWIDIQVPISIFYQNSVEALLVIQSNKSPPIF